MPPIIAFEIVWGLPDELQARCASFLKVPATAARFAQASKACKHLVQMRLVAAKAAHHWRRLAALAKAAAQAPAPRRIAFTELGKIFIDAYLDTFIAASPTERKILVKHNLLAAAAHGGLDAGNWSAQTVVSRLKNARAARNSSV